MTQNFKKRLFSVLEATTPTDFATKLFGFFIVSLIVLNVFAVIASTVQTFNVRFPSFLNVFEAFSVVVFTIEYVLRLWSCTTDPSYRHPVWGRVRFALTPMALVDLAAFLPFYLPMFLPHDLRAVRVIRVFRVFRLLKLARYSDSLKMFGKVLRAKQADLLMGLSVGGILLVLASSLVYFAEHQAQPHRFSSIPASMWWAVITLTTVGYGDMYPVTVTGKILASIIAVMGIGMIAMPAAILSSAMVEEVEKLKIPRHCPHCGGELKD